MLLSISVNGEACIRFTALCTLLSAEGILGTVISNEGVMFYVVRELL